MTIKGIDKLWKQKGLYREFLLVQQYKQTRKVRSFNELPAPSRDKIFYYWKKAVRLLDYKGEWFLAGSYTTGSYIDCTTPQEVRAAFHKMGEKPAFESDVDFYIPGFRGLITKPFFDIIGFNRKREKTILMGVSKDSEKIEVIHIPPIVNDLPAWDWSKFPDEKIPELKRAFEDDNQSAMITLHNQYKLSDNNFCCSGGKVLLYNVGKFLKENEAV